MAVVVPAHSGDWTVADLDAMPETHARVELQDGSLVVSPRPASDHVQVALRLAFVLLPQVEPRHDVMPEFELALARTSLRVPDLTIVRAGAVAQRVPRVEPTDVAVVIEVVSPGSRRIDRLLKPAEYAEAGISGYWRIELDPVVTLTAYVLDSGTYREVGTWGPGETADIVDPIAVAIPIDALR